MEPLHPSDSSSADAPHPSSTNVAENKGEKSKGVKPPISNSNSSHHRSSSARSFLDDDVVTSLAKLLEVPSSHLAVGVAGKWAQSDAEWRYLVTHRRLPSRPWSDAQIQRVLLNLSCLDTSSEQQPAAAAPSANAFHGRWCGVGEREGRCYSSLVRNRHFGLSHGVGRSGDIQEAQPKAVGSTIFARLALCMALDVVRRGSGLDAASSARHAIMLPMCTGMSMSLVLQSLRESELSPSVNSDSPRRNVVLWSRIDQKSCFKAITTAGFECVVVPTRIVQDQVQTDLEKLTAALDQYDGRVVAVLTTTSCFAPRVADAVDHVARLCRDRNVPHVINHAYGLQCAKTNKLVNRACVVGRVDAIVCSTDKNFMVPVGGAIVLSPQEEVVKRVGKLYAGRASSSPIVDVFITLLSMGLDGYQQLLKERNRLVPLFREGLRGVAEKHGERLLECDNSISFGVTLHSLYRPKRDDETDSSYQKAAASDVTQFGSMLFHRCVSGTRVVAMNERKMLGTTEFVGFGSSTEGYPHPYLTAACAIGLNEGEMHEFFRRLDKTWTELEKKQRKAGGDRAVQGNISVGAPSRCEETTL